MLHTPIIPARHSAHRENANRLRIAALIAVKAQDYQRALLNTAGKLTEDTDFALIELLDAFQWICDGDVTDMLADLCRENGVDEAGYRTNDDGDRDYSRDRAVVIGGRL